MPKGMSYAKPIPMVKTALCKKNVQFGDEKYHLRW